MNGRPGRPPVPLETRLRASCEWRGDCLVWTGGTRTGNGSTYGRIWDNGRTIPAHRAAYQLWVGPVPDGLVLDHLCRNTLCVNPRHLEPVSVRTNILRGESPLAKAYASALCQRGHPLSGGNLMQGENRGIPCRRCRTCWRAAQRQVVRRQRERMWERGLTSKGTPRVRQTKAAAEFAVKEESA